MELQCDDHVLVVEDSDDDWDTALEAARHCGCEHRLLRAADGDAAMALLQGHGAPPRRPAFVLLDLNLPGLDGRELLAQIKSDAVTRQLPVVVFSTSASPRDVAACYAAGANAYHVKPVGFSDHVAQLRSLFDYWLTQAVLPRDGPTAFPRA
jgi:CheY-like chemotaxis protein